MRDKLFRLFRHLLRTGYHEPLLVIVVIFCVLAFSAFSEVVEEVLEGESHSIDLFLLKLMRTPDNLADPLGPPWLEEMMRDITGLGGIIILGLITFAASIYMVVQSKNGQAIYLLSTVMTGMVASNLLKIGFDVPRPDLVPHGSITYLPGFPSGHSLMAAIVYLSLGAILAEAEPNRRLKLFLLGLAVTITILVGISRVYLGVHWPSDVLAGWLIGAA